MTKPLLCIDFDGVLHSYVSGWRGVAVIPDPPVAGAFEFLREAVKHFTVCIYSSRSTLDMLGIDAMKAWMVLHGADEALMDELEWPTEKPPAHVTLDDRAIRFDGTWPDIPTLLAFQPWFKRRAAA